MVSHVVVTPFRNEVEFLPELIETMTRQTIIPSEWILVDDYSSDGSIKLVEDAIVEYDWIRLVRSLEVGPRRRGGKIARLVNLGLNSTNLEWSFLSKIDADILLTLDYFERILEKFEDEKLGIASGNCYLVKSGRKKIEKVESDHTRGALKTYRRRCFEDIGGILEIDGWDGLDNLTARYNGWKTKNFPDIIVEHRRATGSLESSISDCINTGRKSHIMSYSWPYLLSKSLASMLERPYVVGGLCIILGFVRSKITGVESINDKEMSLFIRQEQKRKLLNRIWSGRILS